MKARLKGEIMDKSTATKINKLLTLLSIGHSNLLLAAASTGDRGSDRLR
jgi:hypothetical protein